MIVQTVRAVKNKLPHDVRQMKVGEFLGRCENDPKFDEQFNIEFEVVDEMNVLGVQNELAPSSATVHGLTSPPALSLDQSKASEDGISEYQDAVSHVVDAPLHEEHKFSVEVQVGVDMDEVGMQTSDVEMVEMAEANTGSEMMAFDCTPVVTTQE